VFAFPRLSTALLASLGAHRVSPGLARRLFRGKWDPDREGDVEWGMAAFLVLRRSAFDSVGGFDERQWMYGEDLDLCWRLHRNGWRVVYVPGVTVMHAGGASTSQAFGAATGNLPVLKAHYGWLARRRGPWTARAFWAVSASGAAFRVLLYSLGSAVGIRGARSRRRGAAEWLRLNTAALREVSSARSGES
jgi:GT2 family glycosyltransferase